MARIKFDIDTQSAGHDTESGGHHYLINCTPLARKKVNSIFDY
jgi:hypothetical protein